MDWIFYLFIFFGFWLRVHINIAFRVILQHYLMPSLRAGTSGGWSLHHRPRVCLWVHRIWRLWEVVELPVWIHHCQTVLFCLPLATLVVSSAPARDADLTTSAFSLALLPSPPLQLPLPPPLLLLLLLVRATWW